MAVQDPAVLIGKRVACSTAIHGPVCSGRVLPIELLQALISAGAQILLHTNIRGDPGHRIGNGSDVPWIEHIGGVANLLLGARRCSSRQQVPFLTRRRRWAGHYSP